jgi:hypothetical protein
MHSVVTLYTKYTTALTSQIFSPIVRMAQAQDADSMKAWKGDEDEKAKVLSIVTS